MTFVTITSRNNPIVKRMRQLNAPRGQRKYGMIPVEGIRSIEEAIAAGAQVTNMIVSTDRTDDARILRAVASLENSESRFYALTPVLFGEISRTKTPQGVIASVRLSMEPLSAWQVAPQAGDRLLLLEDVQDPGNVGTLIRSAHAFGCRAVCLTGTTAQLHSDKVFRSSMGSVFHIPVYYEAEAVHALTTLKRVGWYVLALDTGGKDIENLGTPTRPEVLVLGNEGAGLSEEVMRLADAVVSLVMPGGAESLNVAMAGSIALYARMRTR